MAKQLLRPLLPVGPLHQQHGHLHILPGGEIRDQVPGVVLPDEADLGPLVLHQLLLAEAEQVQPVHIEPSGGGPVQAADHIQEGALAAAGIADDGHELAALHLAVHTLQGHDLGLVGLVDLDQVVALDDVFRFRHSCSTPFSSE